MKKKLKRFLTLILATCMILSTVSISAAEETSQPDTSKNKYAQSKTATDWIDDVYTDVTLTVGGEQSDLGVDIIYITGGFLAANEVEADLMIESLTDTFTEIVKAGTPVNFGYVPFSADDKPVMELTTFATEEDLALLPAKLAQAITDAKGVYGGENMENALQIAKKMFAASPLAEHPERQHLVLVSSGHTYNFNTGENNELFSTVPVAIQGSASKGKYYYGFKAWMQARNYNPNNYPIPQAFTKYMDYRDWDAYWEQIELWAAADVAAGNKVVYVISDTTDPSFTYDDWYTTAYLNQDSKTTDSTHYAYGLYIHTVVDKPFVKEPFDFANAVAVNRGSLTTSLDKVPDAAKHAISYERAMWEANNFVNDHITGAGINFYPIYNEMKPAYTNGIWADNRTNEDGTKYNHNVTWTNQYIGHSFMNMLARNTGAGVDAVNYSKAKDKSFFDPIKKSILYSLSAGTSVIDYIGYNDDSEKGDIYDFDFVDVDKDNNAVLPILKVGSKTYITEKLATANSGATYSYVFKASEAEESTFSLDYYRGNGKEEEHFIWNFGENIFKFAPVSLTYRLKLMDKNEVPGTYTVYTNQSATLYPKDSDGKDGEPEEFYKPSLEYKAEGVKIRVNKVWEDDNDRDRIRPTEVQMRLSIANTKILAEGENIDSINEADIEEVVTLNEENGWAFSWPVLRKVLNGQEIVYQVEEINDTEVEDNLDKYTVSSEVVTREKKHFTEVTTSITNTYKPEETTVSVEKVWDDANNQDGLQPESIRVELSAKLADGKVVAVDTVELNATNEWKHTWTVWKNDAGVAIEYTVRELPLGEGIQEEYTVAVTGGLNDDGETYSYTITNKHVPYVRDISVNKVWEDEYNRDGIRPESVTAKLSGLVDDQILIEETVVLNESNGWGYKWEGLPVNSQGKTIAYTVEEVLDNEVLKNEYTSVVTESEETPGAFTITNTHVPYKTSVTVNKVWDDQDDKYGFRTESVQVQLLANDKPYGEIVTLSSENEWKYTWDDLFVNELDKNGKSKEIIYTVKEVNVPQYYDATVTEMADAKKTVEGKTVYEYTITNAVQKTSIVLTKYIDKVDPENATAIFRYLITGGPNNDYRANVIINFEKGTVKVDGEIQGKADTDLSDNIGFDKTGLKVIIDGLDCGDYEIIEYAARGYELVKMSNVVTKRRPEISAKAINGVQNPLKVTAIANDPGEAYFWNSYNVPEDYTAVNRFSVIGQGKLNISIKRK